MMQALAKVAMSLSNIAGLTATLSNSPALAAELVRQPVDVLVTSGGTPSLRAASAATKTIPVVFVAGNDPVKLGLVASLSRPGGNLTGVYLLTTALVPKRLGLF